MSNAGIILPNSVSGQFSGILWKLTPASMATRLSEGRWRVAPHLELLSRKLVDVAMGRCKRLIVTMPPRHGKSELVSHWFPVWHTETFPSNRIILCSYEAEFASKWGAKTRDDLLANQHILSMRFKNRMPASHYWETSQGGAMMTAGVGGPITGKGADVLIIDDPIKNSEEANSFTVREKTWEWWTSTARTRLEPGAAVIVMMTRWHEDDLIGRLLNKKYQEKGASEGWEKFDFPAIAEEHDALGRAPGEALWPDRYAIEDLDLIKTGVGKKVWAALYQQRPADTVDDGNVYFSFEERQNVDSAVEYDPRLPICITLDFNVDPMSAVLGQYTRGQTPGAHRAWVLDELVLPDSNTYKMCNEIIKLLKLKYACGMTLNLEIYGDAAGTQRSPNSTKTNWQIVADHFSMQPWLNHRFLRRKANPGIGDRVAAVNTMLCSAAGDRRLKVHPRCHHLIDDFKKVRYAVDTNGLSTTQLDKSNKMRTHISDALGYWIEYLFGMMGRGGFKKGILQ